MIWTLTQTRRGRITLLFCSLSVVALLLLMAPDAHASAGTGGGLPYEDWLTKIRQSITGPVAFAISIIALVGAGALLVFGGDMNGFLKTLVFIVLAIAFIIAAPAMLSSITGTGAVIGRAAGQGAGQCAKSALPLAAAGAWLWP